MRLQGAAFLNPRVELTTVGREPGDDVRLLAGGPPVFGQVRGGGGRDGGRGARAAGEGAGGVPGQRQAAALLANQARLCFASPVRAVEPGSAWGCPGGAGGGRGRVSLGGGAAWGRGRPPAAGPRPRGSPWRAGTTLGNPVRVAPFVQFGGGADLCLAYTDGLGGGLGGGLDGDPAAGSVVAVAPDAPLDASLVAEVPTVWAQKRAALPAASEPERLGLAELDAGVSGTSDGEFRALQRRGGRWLTVASCSLVPGRMADVRVLAGTRPSRPTSRPRPRRTARERTCRRASSSGASPDRSGWPWAPCGGSGASCGSESATWELQCPQSGNRTLELVGPIGLGEPRAVVEVPEGATCPRACAPRTSHRAAADSAAQ